MPNVLVVDDSEVDRLLAGRLLEKQGDWGVTYAADGKAAMEQFATAIPDLVLTDLQMPEMDGLELLTAIKSDFPLTPVILMTAQGSEEIATEALRRGAASYVPKKKLAQDLGHTVERVLLAAREDREHSRLMHHMTECDLRFQLGNDLALIGSLVSFLQQLLRSMPLGDETERMRVSIAVEEALKNAYHHGNLEVGTGVGWPERKAIDQIARERMHDERHHSRRIHVRARVSRMQAVFVVRDDGPGFDAARVMNDVVTRKNLHQSGRGLVLMHTIMDEVRFNDRGNEVTLVKNPPAPEEAGIVEVDDEFGSANPGTPR